MLNDMIEFKTREAAIKYLGKAGYAASPRNSEHVFFDIASANNAERTGKKIWSGDDAFTGPAIYLMEFNGQFDHYWYFKNL